MKIKTFLILVSVALLWTACSDSTPAKEIKKTKNEKSPEELGVDDGTGGEYEDYMAIIDASDSLLIGSSMYYAKNPDLSNETYQVYLLLDDSSNILRIEERYTKGNVGSLLTNFHYFRDGERIASKEIYNEGEGESEMFYERVTYYEGQTPIASKKRGHRFEEYLENELFQMISPIGCSFEKAQRAIAQEGEFQTNFLDVLRIGGLIYIEVGEGDPNGFSTTLLVQQVTPVIQDLISNRDKHVGKKVKVDFREMPDGQGFTFQALLGIEIVEE